MSTPVFKELRRAYGFDEVAIAPGQVSINPNMASTEMAIGDLKFGIPVMASAMDGVVSPEFAILMHNLGGLGVLNLEGVYTRYENPYEVLQSIASEPRANITKFLQNI